MRASAIFFTGITLLFTQMASATACGDFIYKHGTFKKYEYMNNTGIENTKKHGYSSTSAATTESSTASVDPGVSTGVTQSHSQSTSTQGECKWGGFFASKEEYKDYLAQNMFEIKQEMSLGQGGHLEILASAFGCAKQDKENLSLVLQKNFESFVDYEPNQSNEFANSIKMVVEKNPSLNCRAI